MRIIVGTIELTAICGKVWIYDRSECVGRYVTEAEIAELLKGKSPCSQQGPDEAITQ